MERNSYKYKDVDLVGQQFGRLTVIRKIDGTRSRWLCKCECGKEKDVLSYALVNGYTRSCGCLEKENKEALGKNNKRHGMTNTILYHKYCGIKERCFNPNYYRYDRYGGRGITMCDEWKESFEAFRDWAYSAGYDDEKHGYNQTLDRIDVDGNYEPQNCRWVDMKTQSRNRCSSVWLDYHGEKITLAEFCEKNNITYSSFVTRKLKKGENLDDIAEEWRMKHINSDGFMTIKQASELYNVSVSTIYSWIYKGILKSKKCANTIYIPKAQII